MELEELFSVIEYGIKYYYGMSGNRFSMLEYYALTDISPRELGSAAKKMKELGKAAAFRDFAFKYEWKNRNINMESRLSLFHSINDYVLTKEDKLAIYTKLCEEKYPLTNAVFDMAAYHYVNCGIDSLSKDVIKEHLMNSYYEVKNNNQMCKPVYPKVKRL